MEQEEADLRSMAELEPDKFFQFDGEVADEDLTYALLENLQRRQFSLEDVGISSSKLEQLRKLGLVTSDEEDGKTLYFDFLQYLWLQIIMDLEGFGLPTAKIVAIKDHLFNERFLQKNKLTEEYKAEIRTELEMKMQRKLKEREYRLATSMFRNGNTYLPYYFSLVVLTHFLHRFKTNIYLYANGEVRVVIDYLDGRSPALEPALEQPHLVIPLTKYFVSFISDETKAAFLANLQLLNEEEYQVLQAMRRGEVKELSIVFINEGKGRRIDLITVTDGNISADKTGQYVDLIASKKGKIINVKTRDGKNNYFEIADRKTIKQA